MQGLTLPSMLPQAVRSILPAALQPAETNTAPPPPAPPLSARTGPGTRPDIAAAPAKHRREARPRAAQDRIAIKSAPRATSPSTKPGSLMSRCASPASSRKSSSTPPINTSGRASRCSRSTAPTSSRPSASISSQSRTRRKSRTARSPASPRARPRFSTPPSIG